MTASANPLVIQAQQSFTLECLEKLQETVKMLMFILPLINLFILQGSPVNAACQIPLYWILLPCHEAHLGSWRIFKINCGALQRVKLSWHACQGVMQTRHNCHEHRLHVLLEWARLSTKCHNCEDWVRSWLQRSQSHKCMEFPLLAFPPLFFCRRFYSLANRVKN